jgi:hypothetical protein
MTARRRRKSGSGPSATALIAWVGSTGIGAPAVASVPVIGSPSSSRIAGNRAIFLGRACGLAAGTLLACGSVLAGAAHVGDGSLAGDSVPLLNPTQAIPDVTAGAPAEYRTDPPAEPESAAPDVVSVQAVTESSAPLHPPLGRVRRNAPASVAMPADAPSQNPRTAQQPWHSPPPAAGQTPQDPITPVRPVLDPAAKQVGGVAPVGEVLAPTNPSAPANPRQVRGEGPREKQAASPRNKRMGPITSGAAQTVKKVVTPVDNTVSQTIEPVIKPVIRPAARPAMAMLTSLLPIG